MTRPLTKRQMRQKLLKERGLTTSMPEPGKTAQFIPINIPDTGHAKTPLMKMLELKYGRGRTIEEILVTGSLSEVAKALGGEVDVTTLSKWITKFKLRFTPTNLPICRNCRHYKADNCDMGVCKLLMDLEEYELVMVKRQQIIKGDS